MTQPLTEELLTIFWRGEERSGFICYGYWPSASQPRVPFPSWRWADGTEFKDAWLINWEDGAPDWRVLRRDVRVSAWPAAELWQESIHRTLQEILDAGAQLAWCATEGHFADPPALFDVGVLDGGMWAVCGKHMRFECSAVIHEPYSILPATTLAAVRTTARITS